MEQPRRRLPISYATSAHITLKDTDYESVKEKRDPRFGKIVELEHRSTKTKVFRKDMLIKKQALMDNEWIASLKRMVKLRHKNLLQIYGFVIRDSETDGEAKMSLLFEPFARDAGLEFGSRSSKQLYFQDDELFGSLLFCLHVLSFLQSHNISHGCLTPSALLMADDAEIKLADQSLLNKERTLCRCIKDKQFAPYIAPELLPWVHEKEKPTLDDVDLYKADVFSIGMVFLYAATLEEPYDCYDWETMNFDGASLFDRYELVRARYPGPFANLLQYLLKLDPIDRPDFEEITQNIEHYESDDYYERDPQYGPSTTQAEQEDVEEEEPVQADDFVYQRISSLGANRTSTHNQDQPHTGLQVTGGQKSYQKATPARYQGYSPIASYSKPSPTKQQTEEDRPKGSSPALYSQQSLKSSRYTHNFINPEIQVIIQETREKSRLTENTSYPHSATMQPGYSGLGYTRNTYLQSEEPLAANSMYSQKKFEYQPRNTESEYPFSASVNHRFNNPFSEMQGSRPLMSSYADVLGRSQNYQREPYVSAEKEQPTQRAGLEYRDLVSSEGKGSGTGMAYLNNKYTSYPYAKPVDDTNKHKFNRPEVDELISQLKSRHSSPKADLTSEERTTEMVQPSLLQPSYHHNEQVEAPSLGNIIERQLPTRDKDAPTHDIPGSRTTLPPVDQNRLDRPPQQDSAQFGYSSPDQQYTYQRTLPPGAETSEMLAARDPSAYLTGTETAAYDARENKSPAEIVQDLHKKLAEMSSLKVSQTYLQSVRL